MCGYEIHTMIGAIYNIFRIKTYSLKHQIIIQLGTIVIIGILAQTEYGTRHYKFIIELL